MRRFSWFLIVLAALCLFTLAGCGVMCQYRDFSSFEELTEWLQVQEDALRDGYIVSAAYYYDSATDTYSVYCITIIDGNIWYWDPETDEPYADYSLGKVK